jgi:hypothetical protein
MLPHSLRIPVKEHSSADHLDTRGSAAQCLFLPFVIVGFQVHHRAISTHTPDQTMRTRGKCLLAAAAIRHRLDAPELTR